MYMYGYTDNEDKKAPCKDCPRRALGCHSTFEEYIVWSNKRRRRWAIMQKKKAEEARLMDMRQAAVHKALRSKGKKVT